MKKNPALWIVILIAVIGWNLYDIVGPHDEAPSQGVLILSWVALVCGVAGLVGAVMQLAQNRRGA
jgi:hypothetical protein